MKIFEISIFGFTVAPTWYGLMYVLGFLYGYYAIKKSKKLSKDQLESLFMYIFLGVIVGGRLGYIVFYNVSTYLSRPLDILKVWEGGMSFHGGMIGVIVSTYIFSQRHKISFLKISDLLAQVIPVGLFFGRIGNYLNKELLGFPYTGPLAVQTDTGSYFPSPLVEAFGEGIVIFILLNFIHKADFPGKLGSLFLIYYGIIRTGVELFIRTPDSHIGYYFGFFTQGSLLSIPMIVIGILIYISLKNTHASNTQ